MRPGTTTFVKAVPRCKEAERDGNACGWIVDLRQNSGGIVWPMFAVAAPLLGEGKAGSSALPDGTSTPWYVENRRPSLSGKKSPWGPADPVGTPDPPVIVLTTAWDVDRTGRIYDQPLPPDQEVPTPRADIGTDRDEVVVKTATQWLISQDTCR